VHDAGEKDAVRRVGHSVRRQLRRLAVLELIGGDAPGGQDREPDQQLGRAGRAAAALLELLAQVQEAAQGLGDALLAEGGELVAPGVLYALQQVRVQLDVVEDAAAQEGLGEAALAVAGDDDDGRRVVNSCLSSTLSRWVREAVLRQLLQQVVRQVAVGLVDLVDEQHGGVRAAAAAVRLAPSAARGQCSALQPAANAAGFGGLAQAGCGLRGYESGFPEYWNMLMLSLVVVVAVCRCRCYESCRASGAKRRMPPMTLATGQRCDTKPAAEGEARVHDVVVKGLG